MKIQHPTIKGLTREVPDSAGDRWQAAGWLAVSECPTCGATGDAHCTTPSGSQTKRHAKRA